MNPTKGKRREERIKFNTSPDNTSYEYRERFPNQVTSSLVLVLEIKQDGIQDLAMAMLPKSRENCSLVKTLIRYTFAVK